MRGGLLRGKPPLLFLRSGILAGQGSFLYAESRNKQNWMDHLYPPADYRLMAGSTAAGPRAHFRWG